MNDVIVYVIHTGHKSADYCRGVNSVQVKFFSSECRNVCCISSPDTVHYSITLCLKQLHCAIVWYSELKCWSEDVIPENTSFSLHRKGSGKLRCVPAVMMMAMASSEQDIESRDHTGTSYCHTRTLRAVSNEKPSVKEKKKWSKDFQVSTVAPVIHCCWRTDRPRVQEEDWSFILHMSRG